MTLDLTRVIKDSTTTVHRGVTETVIELTDDAKAALTISSPLPAFAIDPRDVALDDLRQQLAEMRAERDRYVARCRELERRLDAVREVVR